MSNIFQKMADFSTELKQEDNKKKGAALAPSSISGAVAQADAWKNFLQKQQAEPAQETKAETGAAKTGNGLIAAPKNAGDLAMKAKEKIAATPVQKRQPWQSKTPFASQTTNDLFQKTVLALGQANPDQTTKNPFEVAYGIASAYENNVRAAHSLDNEQNPFRPANAIYQEELGKAVGGMKAEGKNAQELEALLAESGVISRKQHGENQKEAIIAKAREMAAANPDETKKTEQESLASIYERLDEIVDTGLTDGPMALGSDMERAVWQRISKDDTLGPLIEEYNRLTQTGEGDPIIPLEQVFDWGLGEAQKIRGGEMSYEDADEYLSSAMPMYKVAKETSGDMAAISSAYADLQGIAKRIKEKGYDGANLSDAEERAWQDAISAQGMEWLSGYMVGGEAMTADEQQKMSAFAADRLQQIEDVDGLYSKYQLSPEQQGIWDAYVNTPEGAAKWLEDAAGTKDEQKARDNLYFVSHREDSKEFRARPDYEQLTEPDEQYYNDPLYATLAHAQPEGVFGKLGKTFLLATDQGIPFMSEADRKEYFARYKEFGKENADDYYNYVKYKNNERATKFQLLANAEQVNRDAGNAMALEAMSVLYNQGGGVVGLVDLGVQYAGQKLGLKNTPMEHNGALQMMSKLAKNTRETFDENLRTWGNQIHPLLGEGLPLLHDTVMSLIDSRTGGAIAAGTGLSNNAASHLAALIVDSNSALDAWNSSQERGGTEDQQALAALIAGLAEHYGEKFTIKSFLDDATAGSKRKFADNLLVILHEAGENGLQEGVTELADILGDRAVMGDKSEWETAYNEYLRLTGGNEALASKYVYRDFGLRVAKAAGSGVLMGSIGGAAANVGNRMSVNTDSRMLGGSFSAQTRDSLYSAAEANPEGLAAKLAKKYPKDKASARQVGEIYRAVMADGQTSAAMKDAVKNTAEADLILQMAEESGAIDREAAQGITAMMEGLALTNGQMSAIARSKPALAILGTMYGGNAEEAAPSESAGAGNEGKASENAMEPVSMEAAPGLEAPEAEAGAPTAQAEKETAPRREEPKIAVKAAVKGDAEESRITDITEDKDGGVTVTLENGKTADLDDLELPPDMADVARAAAGMEDQEAAAAMMNAAQETLGNRGIADNIHGERPALDQGKAREDASGAEAAPSLTPDGAEPPARQDGLSGRDFALGFKKIYVAAKEDKVDARTVYGEQLDEKTRRIAEDAGRKAAEREQAQAEEKNRREAKAFHYFTVAEAKGAAGVQFAGVGESLRDKNGDVDQAKRNALLLLDKSGKEFGLQVRVVDRLENGANGKYVKGTNIVYVSLDAEGGAITKAASHEGFHYISEYSPEMKKKITDFVMDKLGKAEGYDVEQRIKEVQEQYRTEAGQELTREEAIEEITADAMLDVIGTEENLRDLMKQSKSTVEKITAWISDTYSKFKEILNRLAGNSPEVRALKDDVEYIGRIRDMYARAMEEARKASQQSQQGYSEALSQDKDVQEYRQEMETAIDINEREESLDKLVETQFLMQEKEWLNQKGNSKKEGLAKYRQALLDYKQKGIALSVALQRQGLAPLSKQGIRAASYAADQLVAMEKERAENAQSNGVKYDIAKTKTEKGKDISFVKASRKVIQGKDSSKWGKQITDYINTTIRNGKDVTVYTENGVPLTITENTAGKAAYWNADEKRVPYTEDLYALKLRIESHIDEAAKVSQGKGKAKADTKGHSFVDKNFNYRRAYFQDFDGKYYSFQISVGTKGKQNTIYNVNEIKEAELPYTLRGAQPQNAGVGLTASDSRVQQNSENVNNKFSLPTRKAQHTDAAESVKDDAELYARMKMDNSIKTAAEMLFQLHRQTTQGGENALIQKGAFEKRLEAIISELREKTHTTMSDQELKKIYRKIYRAMEQAGYNPGEILTYAKEQFQRVLEASPGVLKEQSEETKAAIQTIKTNPVKLTDEQKREIKRQYGSEKTYLQKNWQKIIVSSMAEKTLGEVWREKLSSLLPDTFAIDAEEADMPGILDAWLETAGQKEYEGEYGANIGAMSTDMAMNAMLDFYDIPGALREKQTYQQGNREMPGKILDAADRMSEGWMQVTEEEHKKELAQAKEKISKEANEKIAAARQKAREAEQRARETQKEYEDKYKALEKETERRVYQAGENMAQAMEDAIMQDARDKIEKARAKMAEAQQAAREAKAKERAVEKEFKEKMEQLERETTGRIFQAAKNMSQGWIDAIKEEARRKVQTAKQEAREKVNAARAEYAQKYRERLEKDRQTKQEREAKQGVINEIKRNTKYLNTRAMNGTDTRHIPEELRGAIEQFVTVMQDQRAVFSGQEARMFAIKYGKLAADGQLHDADLAAKYDPDIKAKLEYLADKVKSQKLTDMTMDDLQHVKDIVDHLRSLVDEQNDIQAGQRKQAVKGWASDVIDQMKNRKEASQNPAAEAARKLKYKEMTPVYFARQIGGALGDLIMNVARGESDYAHIMQNAKDRLDALIEEHKVNSWINDKGHLTMGTTAGDKIELTRQMAMTLYAWWEREKRNTTQNAAHLRRGGFLYDRSDQDAKKMKGVNFTKAHVLSDADMARISNWLTQEQRDFVRDMVEYLSKDMAAIGNETSMRLYGWKKFGEKWYFPYPTDSNYRGQDSGAEKGTGERQLKNMGMSKALTENAMNPLKLGNFTDIWKGHVKEMAMYGALAEKLDSLRRVTNYVVGGAENVDAMTGNVDVTAPVSVKKEIERAIGREGVRFLEQWIDDVNGGVQADERTGVDKLVSLFKKGSVAANMSVMLQQPSAFVRAMSMVRPKYFAAGVKEHGGYRATRERMYKNSGTAILKQAGGFDTGTGKGTDWLTDGIKAGRKSERIRNAVDEWTGKGAELADEITWVYMYSAVEHEIADKTGMDWGTEEFNRAVAERFDDVMRYTQVYDSVMAKSGAMRSKGNLDRMLTSFMAEPTLWVNMLMDAGQDVIDGKAGARGKAAWAVSVFIAGSFVNALLQSIATAFRRKKEEGTTWAEKYISEVAENFTDSIGLEGIAGMIPIARDIVSITQGYEVERADMSVISDIWKAFEKVRSKGFVNASADDWLNLAGMAGNAFGIPARNVIRDLSGVLGNFIGGWSAPLSETSGRDILYTILDNATPFATFEIWSGENAAYYDRMEQALIRGDTAKYEELWEYMTGTKQVDGKAVTSGVKSQLKESVAKGLLTEEKAVDILVSQFGMEEKKAWDALDEYIAKEKNKGDEDYKFGKYDALNEAIKTGGDVQAEIDELVAKGNEKKEVLSQVKSGIKSAYGSGGMTRAEAEKALKNYAGITDADNYALYWTLEEWDWLRANPGKESGDYKIYQNIVDAVNSGSARAIQTAVQKHLDHPHTKEQKTGVSSAITSNFKPLYIELWNSGKKTEAANLKAAILTAYEAAGYARDMKNKDIDKWIK